MLARQRALNDSQVREIRAANATVYTAIKGAGKDGCFDAARTARRVVAALSETHKAKMANELERVRLALNAFQGGHPLGCQIIVQQHRAAVADARMTVMEARRIVDGADAEITRKAGWQVEDV